MRPFIPSNGNRESSGVGYVEPSGDFLSCDLPARQQPLLTPQQVQISLVCTRKCADVSTYAS